MLEKEELSLAAIDKVNGLDKVKALIDKVEDSDSLAEIKLAAIYYAASHGAKDTLQYLLEEKKTNIASEEIYLDLLTYVILNDKDIMAYLTDPNNPLTIQYKSDTCIFMRVIIRGEVDIARELIKVNPSLLTNKIGPYTPLMAAVIARQHELANYIFLELVKQQQMTIANFIIVVEEFKDIGVNIAKNGDIGLLRDMINILLTLVDHLKEDPLEICRQKLLILLLINDLPLLEYFTSDILSNYEKIPDEQKTAFDHCQIMKFYADMSAAYFEEGNYQKSLAADKQRKLFAQKIAEGAYTDERLKYDVDAHTRLLYCQIGIEANSYGYDFEDVEGDGDCFFHVCLEQLQNLKLMNNEKFASFDASTLRKQVCWHMQVNQELYEFFLEKDFNKYIAEMRKDGTWSDHLVATAFSRLFNVNIITLNSDGTKPIVQKRQNPNATLYIGHLVGLHFVILSPNQKLTATKTFQDLLGAEAADLTEFKSIDKSKTVSNYPFTFIQTIANENAVQQQQKYLATIADTESQGEDYAKRQKLN